LIRHQLYAEPCGDRPGWYIVDAEDIAYFGDIYISKRAAVAAIRAMPETTETGPLSRARLFIR
jgi:hypothetical protein